MSKPLYIWILKPGKPNIDRSALCKILGIKSGIYTEDSADAPVWLLNVINTVKAVVDIVEPELDKKDYAILAFPASCGRSKKMLMARLPYSVRFHTHYWLNPANLQEIDGLIENYCGLQHAGKLHSATNDTFANIYSFINPIPTQQAAVQSAYAKLAPANSIVFGAIETLRQTIDKRLTGLVKRGIANPKLFTP